MSNLHKPKISQINAFIEILAQRKEKYGDRYPVIWYDLQIEAEEKKILKSLIQGNESIHFFQYYLEVLEFAQSLGISFVLITSSNFDEQRFSQDLQSLHTYGRRMGELEEKDLLKDLVKNISDDMIKEINVYAFYTLLDSLTEAPFGQEEEDVTVMGDMNHMVKEFRQEFSLIFYDPNLTSSQIRRKLADDLGIDIQEENTHTNLMDLFEKLKNYTGPPYHLIMAGRNLEEKIVNELINLKDLLGLYIYRDDDKFEKINNEKLEKASSLEELIPKIKQGLRTRSKLRNNFPAFATDFDAWDRSHINYTHHYLKGFINFKNRKQATDDFLKLAKKIYQDENKELSRFEKNYDKEKKDDILYWYTKDSPIYRLLNNCLRIATADSVLSCRLILKDMESAIKDKYKAKDHTFNGLLYRGAYISAEEWDKLQKNVGREIEMYGFLSTAMTTRVAFNFLRSEPQNKIFITIIVPPLPELDEQGFTDVSEFSEFPGEKEILFNVRSKFQILQADVGKIDDRGNRARHLVLFFGAQLLRKYMTKNKPSIDFEVGLYSSQACETCGKSNNLFGFQQEKAQVRCFDCLVKNSIPKDAPIVALNQKDIQNIVRKIPAKKLQFTGKAPSFSLSDYKCCDCQAKGKGNYYKWIAQDGKDIKQCSDCFEKTSEMKAEILISETSPYTFWFDHQKEWEKIDTDYKSGFSSKHQYEDEGDVYFEVQDFKRCIEYGQRVLNKLKLTRRREKEKARISNLLGISYQKLEKHDKAEIYFKMAIGIGKSTFDPKTIDSKNSLAEVYQSLGRLNEAKIYHEQALNMAVLLFGKEHYQVTKSHNGLGFVYEGLGQLKKGFEHFQAALDLTKRICGENHPETACSYNNLGRAYRHLSKDKEAEKSISRALKIQKSIFGENHPDTATSYHNLAEIYQSFGDSDQAIEYFEKAIKILESFFGKKHFQTVASYNGLGVTFRNLGHYHKALEYHTIALEILGWVKGKEHEQITDVYNNLGMVERDIGNFKKAKDLYMKAFQIERSLYGEKAHPKIARTYTNLALILQDLKEHDKALSFASKSLEMRKLIYGEEHRDTANAYNNLARGYEALGNFSETVKNYKKALVICRRIQGEKHPETALIYSNLGVAQTFIGENEEGKANLNKAYEIRKEILGNDHPETMESQLALFTTNFLLPKLSEKQLGNFKQQTFNNIQSVSYSQKMMNELLSSMK